MTFGVFMKSVWINIVNLIVWRARHSRSRCFRPTAEVLPFLFRPHLQRAQAALQVIRKREMYPQN